ncbi:MAG: inorganic diphosphatase [Bacilli bacterium]|nr:inorganic diphosphatase [Bacilli bacterium]
MNPWHNVNKDKVKPSDFVACIEISKGSKNKYELDKESGLLRLDRILYTSTNYPQNYGFIPLTLALDDDPLDVLVLTSEPIVPLALVDCMPIGILYMKDQGKIDEKIIAVAQHDPFYNSYKDIRELPPHIVNEISHFFRVYKELEDKKTAVRKVEGHTAAIKAIQNGLKRYQDKFTK